MDYDGAIEVIKKVESADTAQKSITLNIGDLGEKFNIKEYNEDEIVKLVGYLDDLEARITGVTPAGSTQRSERRASETPSTGRRVRAKVVKDIEAAAGELGAAMSSAGRSIEEMREKKATEKLVLPNLSIQDQIGELEKISLGLDGNIFTKDQLDIIIQEVKGLSHKKVMPKGDFDKELVELRDKRLKEVMDKLKK